MREDGTLGDGEPEAGGFCVAVGSAEGNENGARHVLGHARAVVADDDVAGLATEGYFELSALGSVADCVAQDVFDVLPERRTQGAIRASTGLVKQRSRHESRRREVALFIDLRDQLVSQAQPFLHDSFSESLTGPRNRPRLLCMTTWGVSLITPGASARSTR
jgi:hypothetical protein